MNLGFHHGCDHKDWHDYDDNCVDNIVMILKKMMMTMAIKMWVTIMMSLSCKDVGC